MQRHSSSALLLLVLVIGLTMPAAAQQKQKPARRPAGPPPSAAASAQQEAEDREAIQELQQREITANLSFNVDGLVALWDTNGVLLPPDHAPVVGIDAIRRYYQDQAQALASQQILAYNTNWNEIQVCGEYAFAWGNITSRLQAPVGNQETDNDWTAMRVLKREPDGGWKIYRATWNNRPKEITEAKPGQ